MLTQRVIVFIMSVSILIAETNSYNRHLVNVQRNSLKTSHPLYQISHYEGDDCVDEQCEEKTYNDQQVSSHISSAQPDYVVNDETNEYITDLMGNNAIRKENSYKSNVDVETFINPIPNRSSRNRNSVFESVNASKCKCGVEWRVKQLGNHHFPQLISTARCITQYCDKPPFVCKEIVRKIFVLKKMEKDDNALQPPLVPNDLRGKYIFKDFDITVGCDCSMD